MKKPRPSARRWLSGLLLQLAVRAVADARRISRDHDQAVHMLRVRMKKLHAVLLLATDDPARSSFQPVIKRLRAIKNGVAGARDTWVTERLAMKLGEGLIPLKPQPAAPEWSARKVIRQTEALLAAIRKLPLPPQSWKGIASRHDRSFRRARRAMKRCRRSHEEEDFHRWRKRVKTLYYQSLALRRRQEITLDLRALDLLGRRLGREHDHTLLLARIPADEPSGMWRDLVEQRRRRLHRQLRRLGKEAL